MRTFVIGDIHGQYKAFVECLRAVHFDYDNDRLIALGDVCDRGPRVRECMDELLKIRHLIYILGNHDLWALEWAMHGRGSGDWLKQGGAHTVVSYEGGSMPKGHIALLARAPLYFEEAGRLFVHAGFDVDRGVKQTREEMLFWDRRFVISAKDLHRRSPEHKLGGYDEIFVGHTPTTLYVKSEPIKFCNVWLMDTGAGYPDGRLTIMDIGTKEFWQAKGSG